jgi:hypothetical protein
MKARIAETEEMPIAMQQLSKHIPAAMDTYITTEEPLGVVFPMQSMLRLYNKDQRHQDLSS